MATTTNVRVLRLMNAPLLLCFYGAAAPSRRIVDAAASVISPSATAAEQGGSGPEEHELMGVLHDDLHDGDGRPAGRTMGTVL